MIKGYFKIYILNFLVPLLIFGLISCKKEFVINSKSYKNQTLDSLYTFNPETAQIIAPYKNSLEKEMNTVIGEAEMELTNSKPNFELAYLVASVELEEARKRFDKPVDFSLMNTSGVRVPSLSKGIITVGKIFELMPFENQLWVLKLSGDLTYKLIKGVYDSKHLVLANVQKIGQETRPEDFLIDNKPLNLMSTYNFSISDYLASGGDGLSFLNDAEKFDLNIKVRDAIIEYIAKETKEGKKIKAINH